MMTMIVGI